MDRNCLSQPGCIPNGWPLLAILTFITTLGLYSGWRRSVPGAKPFAIACLLGFLWMAGIVGQVAADDVSAKITWYKFQLLWQVPAATATTCFSLEYAGYSRWLTRRNLLLLSIPPLLAGLLILTNEFHHLWWTGFTAGEAVRPLFGIGSWILVGYGWALVFVNIVVLVCLYARSPQHRWPVVLIIFGQLACRALYLLYLANLDLREPPYFLVFSITIPFTMYGIALFGFRIFDPLPRARRTAIEQMQEGMVVFDSGWRVVGVNPAAETILATSAAQLRGKTWQQVLSAPGNGQDKDFMISGPAAQPQVNGPSEIVLGTEPEARCYEVDFSPLKDQHNTVVGWLLLLRDVTEQRSAQAQLLKQQQMLAVIREREHLARELHDSLGQVFVFVNVQGQTARRLLARGELEAADIHMARLVEVACEADTDIRESILGLRTSLAQRRLFPALATYLDQYQQRYGIRTQLSKPPALADGALDSLVELQLLRIIQEALTNGAMVLETPPKFLAFISDAWGRWVTDIGVPGPDRGLGGKYLILPPGHDGPLPEGGFFTVRAETTHVALLGRMFLENNSPKPGADQIRKCLKIYPYQAGGAGTSYAAFLRGEAPLAPIAPAAETVFHEGSGKVMNCIPPNDSSYYEMLNEVVQQQPAGSLDPEQMGSIAAIGIVTGQPFAPDARMKQILTEAVVVANATARSLVMNPRDPTWYYYPGSAWLNPSIFGYDFETPPSEIEGPLQEGVRTPEGVKTFPPTGYRKLDARTWFYYGIYGISPLEGMLLSGIGSQYLMGMVDANKEYLNGAKTYKVTLPKGIPAKNFWSFTVYDTQTRSMLDTPQRYPRAGSQSYPSPAAEPNADGSTTVYFAPERPKGVARGNWIQTIPGRGWFVWLCLYGPLEPFFDKTWQPSEIELVP